MAELRDRDLVRLYWPVELRAAFDALFGLEDAMADVVARASQPALGAIKLAWWRERLEELDEAEVPAEPRLQAAAAELLPRGINGRELAGLEEGWATLLDAQPDPGLVAEHGARLFEIGARLLGTEPDPAVLDAGRLFVPADFNRRLLADFDASTIYFRPQTVEGRVRPLTSLAALAARDLARADGPLEPEATPGRAWTLLRHRLTGRI